MNNDQAAALSNDKLGTALTPEQVRAFLTSVKAVAASDGLSDSEWNFLKTRMGALGIPQGMIDEIAAFDVSAVDLDAALADYPKNGHQARMLCLASVLISQVDGYFDEERATAKKVAGIVGVSDGMLQTLEALAQVQALAEQSAAKTGESATDGALPTAVMALRRAIFAL